MDQNAVATDSPVKGNVPELVIVVDTREPEDSKDWSRYFTLPTIRAKLDVGDYSIAGMERSIGVERKTLNDLISCLTSQRQRFEDMLFRARKLDAFYVVIEADYPALCAGKYYSEANPDAMRESISALTVRYGIPYLWAGTAYRAGQLCQSLLVKYHREKTLMLDRATRAAQAARSAVAS